MSAEHFFNDGVELVRAALEAVPLVNPAVALDAENKIIYRKKPDDTKVSLISGGGAGHEPSFTTFVGPGLLTAAISGTIFASPSPSQISRALTHRIPTTSGVLMIIMNYTGDVLNFGLAREKALAKGIESRLVVVGDDVAVGREKGGKVGRRGIAGTCLVLKVVGALVEMGGSLEECEELAELVAGNLVSMGVSLEHVHVPGREVSVERRGGEVEYGMGIHNEQGCERAERPGDVVEVVEKMLSQMLDKEDKDRAFLGDWDEEDDWVLMVNNLGGLSPLELAGITGKVIKALDSTYSIHPQRIYSGTFMTSLNGLGFSISLLRVQDTGLGPGKSIGDLLDVPHEAPGWTSVIKGKTWDKKIRDRFEGEGKEEVEEVRSNLTLNTAQFKKVLESGLDAVIEAEPQITHYDETVGDGDCGLGLKRGAEAIKRFLDSSQLSEDAVLTMSRIANVVEDNMDGTSGAIYSIFINALTASLSSHSTPTSQPASLPIWSTSAHSALSSLSKYTPAQPGDRTLIDALNPFVHTLKSTGDLKAAVEAAHKGAESTRGMKARLGRTVYVEDIKDVPDPGAVGVAEFVKGLAAAL